MIYKQNMSSQCFLRVPVNPRLDFGAPLAEVCKNGLLHPGLRELFLKAYLSAAGEDHAKEKGAKGSFCRTPCVLTALRGGPKGQGSVAERISIKSKLESGRWIVASQTPAGAPLWVLRHFLGCLPRPLLDGSHWRILAVACAAASWPSSRRDYVDQMVEKIVAALQALPTENYLTLVGLILLIRNLSFVTHFESPVMLHHEAVEALSQYFTAAVISRPYRPGLCTRLDEEHKPLLIFLSEHWLEVKELCQRTGISPHRITSESRCEFANPDNEVDRIVWQRGLPPGKVEYVWDNFSRKLSPRTARSHRLIGKPRNRDENWNVDEARINGAIAPVAIQTPKGVYLIPSTGNCFQNLMVEADQSACGTASEVRRPKSIDNPKFEASSCDRKTSTRKVNVKVNGTQTFECEFSEVTNSCVPKLSKLWEKKAVIPLTKSTALLMKNLFGDENMAKLPEDAGVTLSQDKSLASNPCRDVKTVTNAFKDVNKSRDQPNKNFVDELKSNFQQGRRKPSDAKFSSHVLRDFPTAVPRLTPSKLLGLANRLRRFTANSDSTEELFRKTSYAPVSSTNSI